MPCKAPEYEVRSFATDERRRDEQVALGGAQETGKLVGPVLLEEAVSVRWFREHWAYAACCPRFEVRTRRPSHRPRDRGWITSGWRTTSGLARNCTTASATQVASASLLKCLSYSAR